MRRLAWVLSLAIGYLSLSQEILWVRLVTLAQQGRPQAFALVLAVFLLGIAAGAAAGRQLCERGSALLRAAALALAAAAAMDALALLLVMLCWRPDNLALLLWLAGLCAACKGTLFPLVHHLGSAPVAGAVGRSVSRVYLANVLGATLGPIVTGFWLLDVWPWGRVAAAVMLATALLALLTLWAAGPRPAAWAGWAWAGACTALGLFWIGRPPDLVAQVVAGDEPLRLRHLVQNKQGVLHVLAEERPGLGDVTFGGNAYDGRISTDLAVNANRLDRAYLLATLHAQPRSALVVGLSTGAWTATILGLPGVQSVDVLEINPGYTALMRRYPAVSPVLADPRTHLHIDDGRRWLRAHPEARFDLVFQNTTWHWRAYTTLLLSQDYLRQLRQHLNPGGIVAMNATGSPDVAYTAATVFAHVLRYGNFVYMSDAPLQRRADAEAMLRQARLWLEPAFAASAFDAGGVATRLLTAPLRPVTLDSLRPAPGERAPATITDLNLLTEYRHGAALPLPWLRPLLPADAGPWDPARP